MYYVYRHIRKDKNEVFYIGIGTCNTGNTHKSIYYRAYNKNKSRNAYWKNIVNKTEYSVDIIFESNDIEEIKDKEIEFISLYKPTLCNLTDGGYGITSYNHTVQTKQQISKTMKGRKLSKEHYINMNKAKEIPIIMYNDDKEISFSSITEAAMYLGNVSYCSNIANVIKGKRITAYGYKFKKLQK